ncbi:MAG: hypothetical protein Q4D05_09280, partial [Acinetobacter sp.]|nr:hypothetical protein [Acinetobacter sp.]
KLVTHTVDEYVARAIELAENHEERLTLRRHIIENNGLQTLFTGNPKPMGEVLLAKVAERGLLDDKPAKKATAAKTTKKAPTKKAATSTAKATADKPAKTTTRRKKAE